MLLLLFGREGRKERTVFLVDYVNDCPFGAY